MIPATSSHTSADVCSTTDPEVNFILLTHTEDYGSVLVLLKK